MEKANDYLQEWLQHRLVLHELVELIENKHIDYKPWQDAFTMGELFVHIASSTDMFVKTVRNGIFTPPSKKYQYQTIEDVRSFVYQLTEENTKDFGTLELDQLEKEININNYNASGTWWLTTAKDHEIHHKGQLFTYARMIGVENLPFMVKQPPKINK